MEEKGFSKTDIEVGAEINIEVNSETYSSRVDLVVDLRGIHHCKNL